MKTYYDGEEREILFIEAWGDHPKCGALWRVVYKRGDSTGNLIVAAPDELGAYNRFPEVLARMSFNPDDEESNKC